MDASGHRPLLPGSVIAYSGIRPAPWRNGGGETRQIAAGHLGAAGGLEATSGDAWDWRISIADVECAGDFSAFEGMGRILTVIDGPGLLMHIDGKEQRLGRYLPLHFDGGSSTGATLPGGPIRDLNLITRTGTVKGHVAIVALSDGYPRPLSGGSFGVLLQGEARLLASDGRVRELERYDAVVGGGDPMPAIGGSGLLAVLSVRAAS